MSKTKEEILQHHYIHDRGLVNPVLYVHNAMDAWADQKLEEYKERLKVKIKEDINPWPIFKIFDLINEA